LLFHSELGVLGSDFRQLLEDITAPKGAGHQQDHAEVVKDVTEEDPCGVKGIIFRGSSSSHLRGGHIDETCVVPLESERLCKHHKATKDGKPQWAVFVPNGTISCS
jgi:hypothetical protein